MKKMAETLIPSDDDLTEEIRKIETTRKCFFTLVNAYFYADWTFRPIGWVGSSV